jgi:sporulation protein YqfC
MRKNKKKNNSRLNNILEFPEEISNNEPKITIIGFKKIMVENYKGILEYENFFVRLNTTIGVLNINGFNLSLNEMTDEDLIITGNIESIDFESVTDEEE